MNRFAAAASATILATGLALPGLASATDNGLYIGAGIGQASIGDIEVDGEGSFGFDGDDVGYKLFAGWNFAILDLVSLGVEAGYVDFGKADDGGIEVDANGFDAFGVAGVQLGPVNVFGKLGLVAWDADASDGNDSIGDDGTDLAAGLGAGLQFGSFGIRAEYEYFDIDSADDVSLISASALWVF
jgi:opacity protein-like surface antigen